MPFARPLAAAALACLALTLPAQQPDAEVHAFATKLLAQMTLTEKIEQMEQSPGQFTPDAKANEYAKNGIGSFLFLTDPKRIHELQEIAVTQSRLHIPLLFGYDVIHGFRTIYPNPLAMASSWDPEVIVKAETMAAQEARAAGVQWAFAPMVDIARDPRWGRIMEGAGEDPYLGEQMAAAHIRGLQGPYPGAPGHVLASVKHLGGYGAAVGGRDYDSSDISDEQLYNVYLRPYRAAVRAGSATVMSAYMNLNSVPATGNTWLLQDTLRKEWGFQGFVVSDWDAVKNLQTHGYAASPADAAIKAVRAGVNMEMTSTTYRDTLPQSIQEGKITPAQIDALVRPILEMKYRLGLFTNPYADPARFTEVTLSAQQRETARQTAEKTAILLRNESSTLPLKKDIQSIALIGPLAETQRDIIGGWAIHATPADAITIAQGLREKLPNTRISVTKGVEIDRTTPSIFDSQVPPTRPTLTTDAQRTAEFNHALDLAKQADTTILVLGELQNMNSENASRAEITLPGKQQELLEAVVALGKPVVLVLMTGRPLNLTWASTHVPAILNIWYPGTEGGHAVANLLTGDANPSGHLTLSWPRSIGQIPTYYNTFLPQDPENSGKRYWDEPSTPLYPFGYGLSYSSFALSDLTVTNAKVHPGSPLQLSVKLQNTSQVAGEQVVQLYTHQRAGSAARPIRELKAFHKIVLAPSESKTVQFTVPAEDLSFWSASLHKLSLEPGTFDLWVGEDSTAPLHATFQLTTP